MINEVMAGSLFINVLEKILVCRFSLNRRNSRIGCRLSLAYDVTQCIVCDRFQAGRLLRGAIKVILSQSYRLKLSCSNSRIYCGLSLLFCCCCSGCRFRCKIFCGGFCPVRIANLPNPAGGGRDGRHRLNPHW